MSQNNERKYPRKLSDRETEWLFYLLPEDRPLYAEYRAKINSMLVIDEGRFGEGNLVLGHEGDEPDLSYSSLPVFACGQIIYKECCLQVSIHELFDNKIEVSISNISGDKIPGTLTEASKWSYSYWKPGSASPFEGDRLREIDIKKTKGINIAYVFENLKKFTDDEFIKALVQYNKQWKKAELLDSDAAIGTEKKGLFKKLFTK